MSAAKKQHESHLTDLLDCDIEIHSTKIAPLLLESFLGGNRIYELTVVQIIRNDAVNHLT